MKQLFFTVFILLLFIACAKKNEPSGFDYGHVNDSIYTNSFFGFEARFPKSWVVQNEEQVENISKAGQDLAAGDDANMKAIIKASEVNTANLLAVYEFEVGSAVTFNPSIMIIAENIKAAPGLKNGSDYLFQARKIITQSQIKYDSIDEVFAKRPIGGENFYKMKATLTYLGNTIHQVYYSSIQKGFAFNIIISFSTDEQKESLEGIINSMKFSDNK